MNSELRDLYQEIILDHNRSPRNFRSMPDPDRRVEAFNPLCGDHYTVYVKLRDGVIADVSFEGAGCAISKASASLMSSMVKGRTKEEAERLFGMFHRLVTGGTVTPAEAESMGKLAAFANVSEFPVRVKCASLAWHTLHAAVTTREDTVSTE
ncbi:MAG TPA: SUF system NifU family Fe-S cluster assembly protein [Bacteroidota bacterium]|nr:SUF system NifU family Fe-S cluster assembly protein [Bacteroidota bacterium]